MNTKRWYLLGAIIFLAGALSSCGDAEKQPSDTALAAGVQLTGIQRVPALVAQFLSLDGHGGVPFTFRYWHGDQVFIGSDPSQYKHYQGILRVQGPDGTPYLYLTRNGNPIFLSGETYDYPGEILIVEMGSASIDGEALGSNCAGGNYENCQPPPADATVRSIRLNGLDLAEAVDWKHPGSGQQVGDLLFIPVEKNCNYLHELDLFDIPEVGRCTGDEGDRGAILVLRIADPADPAVSPVNPGFECQIELFRAEDGQNYGLLPKIGTLAATMDSSSYLFAHTTGGSYKKETALTFYEIPETQLCQGNTPIVERVYTWNSSWLLDNSGTPIGEDEWHKEGSVFGFDKRLDWQTLNFLKDTQDNLYLIGTDKSATYLGAIPTPYDDYAKLFRLERYPTWFTVHFIAEKHLYLKDPVRIGDLDAAGGVYVSPAGRLHLYTATHDNGGPEVAGCEDLGGIWIGDTWIEPTISFRSPERCNTLPMGEFTAAYFHPPVVTFPSAMEADEGIPATLEGFSFTDPIVAGQSWEATVQWGDGDVDKVPTAPGETLAISHVYEEGPGTHMGQVTVTDSDGFTGSVSFEVTVSNVAPTVTVQSITDEDGSVLGVDLPFIFPGRMLTLAGSYTDPGVTDTHTGSVAWGDGTQTDLGAVSGPVQAAHAYDTPGVYTAALTVIDDDGGVGTDSSVVRVLSVLDGLGEIVEMLRPDSGNRFVRKAMGDLEGQNSGLASNGAIDLLAKGNTNAAAVHIGHAIRELKMALARDPGLDLWAPLELLEMAKGRIEGER